MSLSLKIFAILFLLVILFLIIYILRKGRITIKYSLVWIFSALILLLFVIFPDILYWLTSLLGFNLGSNMVFAGLIAMLMFICLALTIIISGQNNKIRLLIQEVSILKEKINAKDR